MPTARRLASFALTLLGASLLVFALFDLLPGNAAAALLGTDARPDTVAALQAQLGLGHPAALRFLAWIQGAVTGDLGRSATYGVLEGGLIADRLAVTLPLAGLALLLAVAGGVGAGVMSASRAGSATDRLATAHVQVAVPDFRVGLLLVLLFSTTLRWFPAGGFPGWGEPLAAIHALLLPAPALPRAAVPSRVTRAAVLDGSEDHFIRTARTKGLFRTPVLWRHAVPNALPPVATIVGLQSSFLVVGGAGRDRVQPARRRPARGPDAGAARPRGDPFRRDAVRRHGDDRKLPGRAPHPWLDPRLRNPR